jgi:hypothetical protein
MQLEGSWRSNIYHHHHLGSIHGACKTPIRASKQKQFLVSCFAEKRKRKRRKRERERYVNIQKTGKMDDANKKMGEIMVAYMHTHSMK